MKAFEQWESGIPGQSLMIWVSLYNMLVCYRFFSSGRVAKSTKDIKGLLCLLISPRSIWQHIGNIIFILVLYPKQKTSLMA